MIDEILERAVPWGFFIGVGALIGAAFPRETRTVARSAMVMGMRAADWAQTFGAEAYEKGQDVFAEARSEYEQAQRQEERGRLRVVPATRRRRPPRRGGQQASTEAR